MRYGYQLLVQSFPLDAGTAFTTMLADLLLVVTNLLKDQVGKGQGGIQRGQLAANRLVGQGDIRFVDQLVLNLGPGILKNGAQLDFTDFTHPGHGTAGLGRFHTQGQMDRIIAELAERVLIGFAFCIENFKVSGKQVGNRFYVFEKRTDDTQAEEIIDRHHASAVVGFVLLAKLVEVGLKAFDAVLDGRSETLRFKDQTNILGKLLQ